MKIRKIRPKERNGEKNLLKKKVILFRNNRLKKKYFNNKAVKEQFMSNIVQQKVEIFIIDKCRIVQKQEKVWNLMRHLTNIHNIQN